MKRFYSLLLVTGIIILASCGGAENKVDTPDTTKVTDTSTQTETKAAEPEKPNPTPSEPKTEKVDSPVNNTKNTILANIDKYLVSSASGTTVTVENTLNNASFQRAYVEVSEVNDAGAIQKTDFYTVTNIEPGGTKSFKIPGTSAKLSIHIIKAKSDELTGGEMILVGSRYSPK